MSTTGDPNNGIRSMTDVSLNRVVDVIATLNVLAADRPVFHSEADFQFAFAWTAKQLDPRIEVRLEMKPRPGEALDVLLSRPDLDQHLAIELKYLTRGWNGTVRGESFALRDQGASDIRCYDVVKDISRVERFVVDRPNWTGCAIVLTNSATYWNRAVHVKVTNADEFRIYDGARLSGVRDWGPNTGTGTKRTRETPVALTGEYDLEWTAYSRVDSSPAGTFRALVIYT